MQGIEIHFTVRIDLRTLDAWVTEKVAALVEGLEAIAGTRGVAEPSPEVTEGPATPAIADATESQRPEPPKEEEPSVGAERLTAKQAAEVANVSEGLLSYYRSKGGGPTFHKEGRRVYYLKPDVLAWNETRGRSKHPDADTILDSTETARCLRIKPEVLAVLRARGAGPPHELRDGRVVYRKEAVLRYIAKRGRTRSHAAEGPKLGRGPGS